MIKYRVKLKSSRIIGPILRPQIFELAQKGYIDEDDLYQEFPAGDWKKISEILDLSSIKDEATFVKKIESDFKENKEKYIDPSFPQEFSFKREETSEEDIDKEKVENKADIKEEASKPVEELDKTVVTNKKELESIDKTIVNPKAQDFFKKLEEEKKDEVIKKEIEQRVDYENDKTQLADINELKQEIIKKAKENELGLKNEEDVLNTKSTEALSEEIPVNENKKRKSKNLIYFLLIVLLGLIFLDEEKSEKKDIALKPYYPDIKFPVEFENPDKEKGRFYFEKGKNEYLKGYQFEFKINALALFLKSLENDFENKDAMSYYIMTASELLIHAKDIHSAGSKLFKLIEISRSHLYSNVNLVTGAAYFYKNIDKCDAAINLIEKYITIENPSLKLFSIFLHCLIKEGDFSRARRVYDKLTQSRPKPIEVYVELLSFDFLNDEYAKIEKVLTEAFKDYPLSPKLFFYKAKLDTYREDKAELLKTLKSLKSLLKVSPAMTLSRYYEYEGLYYALEKQNKKAVESFQYALQLYDSPELRARLATLETTQADFQEVTNALILESKSIDFMNKAKAALEKSNLDTALNFAINAVDISPNYSPAQILLSQIQVKKGFFELAIKSLEENVKKHPVDPSSNFALLDAYTKAFKFNKARNHIAAISNTKLKESSSYAKKLADFFYASKDYLQAISWYTKAIDLEPLDDLNYYKLSQIFFYKKDFKKSKSVLRRAIDLNPSETSYRLLFSKNIYEMESSEAALGYLRSLSQKNQDSPEIQGQIAIYYFRSGQLTKFEAQKKKLEASTNKTERLYEFLIQASLIDEKFDQVVEYGKKLLAINPGNLETRMLLGRILFEQSKFKESLEEFKEVKLRLPTYPKLLYYISKIYLLTGDVDKAIEIANKELKSNPNLESTYILLGDIYREQDKFTKAQEYYKEAQKKNPNSAEALLGLAFISSKKNQYEVALDLYKKAASIDIENPRIHKYIGDTYRNLGQGKLAIESYKVYLELAPESKYRKEIENYIKILQ